jgi:hypothetical protein
MISHGGGGPNRTVSSAFLHCACNVCLLQPFILYHTHCVVEDAKPSCILSKTHSVPDSARSQAAASVTLQVTAAWHALQSALLRNPEKQSSVLHSCSETLYTLHNSSDKTLAYKPSQLLIQQLPRSTPPLQPLTAAL